MSDSKGHIMKAHHFDNSSFIGGWYIPEKVCDDLIDYFEDNISRYNHLSDLDDPSRGMVEEGCVVQNLSL